MLIGVELGRSGNVFFDVFFFVLVRPEETAPKKDRSPPNPSVFLPFSFRFFPFSFRRKKRGTNTALKLAFDLHCFQGFANDIRAALATGEMVFKVLIKFD